VSLQRSLTRSLVMVRTWPVVIDMGVGLCALALFIAIVRLAAYWMGTAVPVSVVSGNARSLPVYAFYSVMRIGIAYVLSLVFAVAYGYIAARNARAEAWMIAVLDILQSIPVLSFLPPVLLAMIALIPHRQFGIELGVILLIFTGQVWNLAFSFYSSMKAIPREMLEASRIYRYSGWQRFWQLEMPYATTGLIWNSIISVANGWFALMACEMFQLKNRNFELPGLGSYIQNAAYDENLHALLSGIAVIVLIVVATDQLIWRPLIAWSEKFKFEQVESTDHVRSPILTLMQRSRLLGAITSGLWARIEEPIYRRLAQSRERKIVRPVEADSGDQRRSITYWFAGITFGLVITWGAMQCALMLRHITWAELRLLFIGAAATFLRVNASLLLSALWTVPVGVAIGFSPKLARIVQPIAQVLASVPATAFFPILLIGLLKIGGGLGIGSIALMLLGTQWYILFNVIAGAMSIPSDLREAASLYKFTQWQRWTTLIFPGIFPYLITGMVTASGGAWNASVFAEYANIQNRTIQTIGLGAQIDTATADGNFPILLLATILVALIVVTMNRLVWRRLYRLSETRYKLEG